MLIRDLLQLSTVVGIGVERTAFGGGDNPLDDIIEDIATAAGPRAAALVDGLVAGFIGVLGPDLLADVDPITLPPGFDINNGRDDTAVVTLGLGPYILDIGSPVGVGNLEFGRLILGGLDGDDNDDDAFQILQELITGRTAANLDFENKPGIVGVDLVELTPSSYTIEIKENAATDLLTLNGPNIEAVLDELDSPANIRDRKNGLSLVDVGSEPVQAGGPFLNPIFDLIGRRLDDEADVSAILAAAETGDDRVERLGLDADYLSVVVNNPRTGTSDVLVLTGPVVERALEDRFDDAESPLATTAVGPAWTDVDFIA